MNNNKQPSQDRFSTKPSLKEFDFFRDLSAELVASADALSQWISLPAGRALYEVGEPSNEIFAVISGGLAVYRTGDDGQPAVIGHVRAGELVGEMSFFARQPRRSLVRALRDTELLRIDQDLMRSLVAARPDLMRNIIQLILDRTDVEGRPTTETSPSVIAIISIDPSVDAHQIADKISIQLEHYGLKPAVVERESKTLRAGWFDELERTHSCILLVASLDDLSWSRSCLRQADRSWILSRTFREKPERMLAEETATDARHNQFDLVAVDDAPVDAHGVKAWQRWCGSARLLKINTANTASFERGARILSGKSVGLVLSGGGARAYAHVGVVRAMREARRPIDFVGGTSMGAIIAACVAMGWDDQQIDERIRESFVASNPLGDFVLPVVALTAGGRVDARLKKQFGETRIEDLSVPFFAVSTSLTKSAFHVHKTGLLRQALRASISLPGILPPVVMDNELLVDGAVLNNLPVGEMRKLHAGAVIGVDVAQSHGINLDDFRHPPNFLGWALQYGLRAQPPIVTLLMRAGTAAVDPAKNRVLADLVIAPSMPDIDLRDWRRYDDAVSAGYAAMTEALSGFDWKQLRMTV